MFNEVIALGCENYTLLVRCMVQDLKQVVQAVTNIPSRSNDNVASCNETLNK
jgi:hypothetical protein